VDGDPHHQKWVLTGANGHYLIGAFDGAKFTPEAGSFPEDYGGSYYAVQTFSDIPAHDGRRIQIAWMRDGQYPQMPFNQQMSFPCELTLRTTPEGLRLYRWPVKEIAGLYEKEQHRKDITLRPGDPDPLHALTGDLWDIQAEFELQDAKAFGFQVRNADVRYSAADKTLTCLGKTAPLSPNGNHITLRLLVDRTSLEVFGNGGQVSLTSCFLPRPKDQGLSLYAEGGSVKLVSLTAHSLRSAWPAATPGKRQE